MRILINDEIIDLGTNEQIKRTLEAYTEYKRYESIIDTKRDDTIEDVMGIIVILGIITVVFSGLMVWNLGVEHFLYSIITLFIFTCVSFLIVIICDHHFNLKKREEKKKYLSNEELNSSLFSYLATLKDEQFAKMFNFLLHIDTQETETDEIKVIVNDKKEKFEFV